MLRNPKVADVLADAQTYDSLKEHPAWFRLNDKVKSDEGRFMLGLARRLMAGEDVSQREIDFHRGWYRACVWLLGHPEQAMGNLEKVVKTAWAMEELSLEQASEEESPYL